MLTDRALRTTFRNYSTLFLLVALLTVTAKIVYGFVYRDVLELHDFVRELKASRTVNGVTRQDLEAAERSALFITVVQVLLAPLLVGAARRIIARDEAGEVPTVPDGLAHPRRGGGLSFRWGTQELIAVILGLVLAAAVSFLALRVGLLIAEPLPDRWNFVTLGLVRGLAPALGAPFLLGTVAIAGRSAAGRREKSRST